YMAYVYALLDRRGTPTSCCAVIWIGDVRLPHDVWLFGSERYAYLMLCGYLDQREKYAYLKPCGYLDRRGTPTSYCEQKPPSPYNGIISRSGLRKIHAVPSTDHEMLKFPVEGGIAMIRSSTVMIAECRMITEAQDTSLPKEPLATEGIKENLDIFAWKPADMIGVPRSIAKHHLNFREGCQPIRQKRRGHASDRNKAIQEEVVKLVEAEITRGVHYHDWLSNPVMVKKHDGSWRMCVDFKYLNKLCPKYCYPLPKIDWKVESLFGYPFKCFLDAYKRYHEIQMAEEDEEKTDFHTNQGVFCYTKMSFGLKNVEATYQRLVDKSFKKQIGKNLEVTSSACKESKPAKRRRKRFLSKFAKKSLPFFKTLKRRIKKSDFWWRIEAEKAFQNMKKCIAELPMVTAPKPKEELRIYLRATREAVSAVLLAERDLRQIPIYFVSCALQTLEINYSSMEKLVLALVHATRRLRRYFQAHPIMLTSSPRNQMRWDHQWKYKPNRIQTLVAGLQIVEQMGVKKLIAKVDSRLIANQINGSYEAKEKSMTQYLEKAKTPINNFKMFSIEHVPRSEIKKADALSKITSISFAHLTKQVLVETLERRSIEEREILAIVEEEEGYCCMTTLVEYLTEGTMPVKTKKARAIKARQDGTQWLTASYTESHSWNHGYGVSVQHKRDMR
nr:reverse transcriptase domain-containing protein [Tanacetum cinerariifolium]